MAYPHAPPFCQHCRFRHWDRCRQSERRFAPASGRRPGDSFGTATPAAAPSAATLNFIILNNPAAAHAFANGWQSGAFVAAAPAASAASLATGCNKPAQRERAKRRAAAGADTVTTGQGNNNSNNNNNNEGDGAPANSNGGSNLPNTTNNSAQHAQNPPSGGPVTNRPNDAGLPIRLADGSAVPGNNSNGGDPPVAVDESQLPNAAELQLARNMVDTNLADKDQEMGNTKSPTT
ncbi:hypothetical protein MBLNU457_4936t2 [Dothideomycetes sp. NU457]